MISKKIRQSPKKYDGLDLEIHSIRKIRSNNLMDELKKEDKIVEGCESFSYQGTRDYNEDRILIEENLKLHDQLFNVYAVFDGHGGSSAAEFLRIHFVKIL